MEVSMGSDPRKRQKKQERQAAKRKEKRHRLVRGQSTGLAERMTAATLFPILHCWMGRSFETQGVGWVLLSRQVPSGRVAVATFLVDRYCLGVKAVWAEVLDRPSYDEKYARKMRADMPGRNAAPAEARKFIEGAVAYANSLGLRPHPDYAKVMHLFGDVNPADSDATFEFGQDGMPFFIAGPRDSPARCMQVLAALNESCGPGGFHYLVPVGPEGIGGGPISLRGPGGAEDFEDER
jgi:hypothetical protein